MIAWTRLGTHGQMHQVLVSALELAAHLRAAGHWSKVSTTGQPPHVRWWESPAIIEHVNEKICGRRLPLLGAGTVELIERKFPGRKFPKAISIGCGHGEKEMMLVTAGLVEEFHLFELSRVRIEAGKKRASELGIQRNVIFHNEDGLRHQKRNSFDLVHWSGSLHHMLNADKAIGLSHAALKSNGLFFMDDFVGPTRMQWSDKMLRMASRVRAALPEKFLQNPYQPGDLLPRRLHRPKRWRMLLSDPTECADSAAIIPSLQKWFPSIGITPTGGAIYHLALNDVLHNIDEIRDREMVNKLLKIDDLCTLQGEYHYAVAIALKP